jgi:hypothetical protein
MAEENTRESGSLSEREAVARLTGLLDSGSATPEKPRKEEQRPEGEAEAAPAEAEGEEPEASDVTEDAGDDASEDASEDTGEPAEEPRFTVRVDDTDVEVTLEELTKGYSRRADYTRKTQQLAEDRKALERDARQAADLQRHYAERLQWLESQFPPEQEPNWEQLAAEDPSEYVRQKAVYDARQQRARQLRAAQNAEWERAQHDQAVRLQDVVRKEGELLLEKLPGWREEKTRTAEKAKLVKYAQSIGYTTEELNGVYDHRPLLVLHKAMKYDELINSKASVNKKANEAPKMMKPGAASDRSKAQLVNDRRLARLNRVRKSGSTDDAVAYLRGK